MAGDPLNGGGFVVVNGIRFNDEGEIRELETPYPGGNLYSLASGGAIYVRSNRKSWIRSVERRTTRDGQEPRLGTCPTIP